MENNKVKPLFVIKEELIVFEEKLRKIINSSDNFLKKDLENFMFKGAKRLRPIFVLLFSKILKIESSALPLKIALTVELFHNASLVHDDIIDLEKTRRNDLTFVEKYGSKLAVLEGDLLLSFGLKELSETNLEILKIFSDKIQKTLSGEIKQNSTLDHFLNEEEYLNKTFNKTGNLFFAGLESLFCLKEIKESEKNSLLKFLKNYTLAFQIKNDIDNFKENFSSDFENGNYTLPVIYFKQKYGARESDFSEIDFSSENFKACLLKAKEKVEKLKKEAINSLETFENSKYKEALIEICAITL